MKVLRSTPFSSNFCEGRVSGFTNLNYFSIQRKNIETLVKYPNMPTFVLALSLHKEEINPVESKKNEARICVADEMIAFLPEFTSRTGSVMVVSESEFTSSWILCSESFCWRQ